MQRQEVKYGAILSYILIVLNTLYGFVISPYILTQLGESSFGVYKTISSFSATLMVLDLGIGTTVMRYTAKFWAEKKHKEIGNFAAMGIVEAFIMSIVVVCVSIVLFFLIDPMYSATFSGEEISLAKKLIVIIIINMILVIHENVLNGVIMGMNRMTFSNLFKVVTVILRAVIVLVVLKFWHSAIGLVLISLFITVFIIFVQHWYIRKKLGIKIKLVSWDRQVFKESMGYTMLMFIQTIAVQFNGNIDNTVIGAVIGSVAVAIYSFGIQIFGMFESLAMAFSNLMLPTVSQKIANGASDEEMQQVVTRVGRLQFVVLGAALAGFIVLGKEFIQLWLGDGFGDVYYLSLIMMVPVIFTLIQNVCLSILRARNMMKFRTFSLIFTACFNMIFTIIGTMLFGYYAAAVGTGLSIVVGSITMMNIYYHKRIGFRVFKFYRDVLNRTWLCATVPAVIIFFVNMKFSGSWMTFLIKVILYLVIYLILLVLYGLNKQEKQGVFAFTRRNLGK